MKLDVLDTKKAKVGEVDLLASVFETEINQNLLHESVVSQLASRRAGTHSTKGRSDVRGGGRKPWAQKGTGRARAGTIRSPLFRGGGITFGPTPRDYGFKLPKKARSAALRSALTVKATENAVAVIDQIGMDTPKTKDALAILTALGLAGSKILVVLNENNRTVELAFRNIPRVKLILSRGVNVYDLLNADHVVFTKDALDAVQERLAK